MTVPYAAVRAILQKIVDDWTKGNNKVPPDFVKHHKSQLNFGSATELLASSARGLPLIQAKGKGQGMSSNLVVALIKGVGVFARMPEGGLDSVSGKYLDTNSPEIQTISQWIEDGCPDP